MLRTGWEKTQALGAAETPGLSPAGTPRAADLDLLTNGSCGHLKSASQSREHVRDMELCAVRDPA